MIEETEYDDVITCKHSYSEKCHTTYTTDFEPQQEEACEGMHWLYAKLQL